ncbi:MAG: transporter substrate-binding domain-containing protein [Deltaproteobacteria bacterium]|jgi:ABC-type amino acid transport substrate-binding protein/signal transduction histidine kinase|nr:transporter substrate-binding domain-containing protein [Deltaproteobacteria bacterium]
MGNENIRITFLTVLVFFWVLNPSFSQASDHLKNYTQTSLKFTDIYGVTEDDISDIKAICDLNRPLILGALYSTEAFHFDNEEMVEGFLAELAAWLSQFFGLEIEPRIFTWDNLLIGLDDGSIDLTNELTKTPARQLKYFMTEAIAERSTIIVSLKDKENPLILLTEGAPVKIGLLSNTVIYSLVRPVIASHIATITVKNHDEALKALLNGSIDAYIEDETARGFFDRFGQDVQVRPFLPMIFSEVSLSTANKKIEPIIRIMKLALINDKVREELAALYKKSQEQYFRHAFFSSLTEDEQAYLKKALASGDPIYYGADADNYPISFYNHVENKWQGSAFDVLAEVERSTGLNFKRKNERPLPWPTILNQLEKEEIAFVPELIVTRSRRGKFIWPSQSYSRDYFALISRVDKPDISLNDIIYSKIGLVESTAWTETFHNWFPHHTDTHTFISSDAAFEALEKEEIDILMGRRNLILKAVNFLNKPGFKVNYIFNNSFASTFGFNHSQTQLCSIVNKAMRIIETQLINERWRTKIFDTKANQATSLSSRLLIVCPILAIIALTTGLLFYTSRRELIKLRMTCSQNSKELKHLLESSKLATKLKGHALAAVGYKLKNLTSYLAAGAEQTNKSSLSEEASSAAQDISQTSKEALALIDGILDFSKTESERIELKEIDYHLDDLIEELIDYVCQKLPGPAAQILVQVDNNLPSVLIGDTDKIKRMLFSLLTYNLNNSSDDGYLRFSIEGEKTRQGLWHLTFIIADTFGSPMAIDETTNHNLYKPPCFGHSNRLTGLEGTELSLAIAVNIAKSMDGEVQIKDFYGQGSLLTTSINQKAKDETPLAILEEKFTVVVYEPGTLQNESLIQTLDKFQVTVIESDRERLMTTLTSLSADFLFVSEQSLAIVTPLLLTAKSDIQLIVLIKPSQTPPPLPSGAVALKTPVYCSTIVKLLNNLKEKSSKFG